MSAPVAQETRALTFERLLELRRVLEVELSADGERIAFTVAPISKERGKSLASQLWAGDVDGEAAPLAEEDGAETLPRFSPDGAALAYASDAGHTGRMSLRVAGRGEVGSIAGSVED